MFCRRLRFWHEQQKSRSRPRGSCLRQHRHSLQRFFTEHMSLQARTVGHNLLPSSLVSCVCEASLRQRNSVRPQSRQRDLAPALLEPQVCSHSHLPAQATHSGLSRELVRLIGCQDTDQDAHTRLTQPRQHGHTYRRSCSIHHGELLLPPGSIAYRELTPLAVSWIQIKGISRVHRLTRYWLTRCFVP